MSKFVAPPKQITPHLSSRIISQINPGSISLHWAEILYTISSIDPDILCISETKTKPTVIKKMHKVPGYRWIFPSNFELGFAVLIRNSLTFSVVTPLICESLLLVVSTPSEKILLATGYNRPNTTNVISLLTDAVSQFNPNNLPVVYAGDFNARHKSYDHAENKAGKILKHRASFLETNLSSPRLFRLPALPRSICSLPPLDF